ncbi:[SSU ribosomal protein S5P]-alanine acetyltransferase [Kribbella voronezhensis]|uniref:[SSU ribosomal protein S5P]-alanine acetyltransferase n=1 Tax=Kribbella voronezhensis TaxID=2512212 RepID=A0A4R7SYG8_9ACTN|nr:GNAT family protein [Kribbella voronezhensis]TDU84351.1 [SSU ribosomal protein S5P]-alanine acetyltransferase [Kribbella voronezhensis]
MNLTRQLTADVELRLVRPSDAESFCAAQYRCREQLRPWEPVRKDEWYEPAFQAARFQAALDNDLIVPWVLATSDRVIGTMTLSNIVRGPWRNADLGYWVDAAEVGRGLASAGVAAVCELADTELLLHRIAASTLVDNEASQRVLQKNGFTQFGFAPEYLHINGAWRDHNLYQRILNKREPGETSAGR